MYHWEPDAATGGAFAHQPPGNIRDAVNATEAAEIGSQHGRHLGELLAYDDWYPNLKKIHFIAHSAGSWVAFEAARHLLLSKVEMPTVQVTLLDPFMPNQANQNSFLGMGKMSVLDDIAIGDIDRHPWQLENYYAWDITDRTANGATSCTFDWYSVDSEQKQIDWNEAAFPNTPHYNSHAGPVEFYADSVNNEIQQPPWEDWSGYGWARSMLKNEPHFEDQLQLEPKNIGDTARLTVTVDTRRHPYQTPASLSLQWEKKDRGSPYWEKMEGATSSTLSIPNISAEQTGSQYRVVATLNGLSSTSNAVTLSVANATVGSVPPAPINLTVQTVSASQINLTWKDTSSNETGFTIQRRTGTAGSWETIKTLTSNREIYSDTGLTPETAYSYRITAYNSTGVSDYSNTGSARTPSSVATYTVQVDAVDFSQSTKQVLAVSISFWTGLSTNFQSMATGFSRTVEVGQELTVSAPATLEGGLFFQYWLRDSITKTYNTTAQTTMKSNHAFIAVYSDSPASAKNLSSVSIEGPSSVDEHSTTQYKATAMYSNGSSSDVTGQVTWMMNSSYAEISHSGLLDSGSVSSNKLVEISATFSANGTTETATKDITIRDTGGTSSTCTLTVFAHNGTVVRSPRAYSYEAGTVVDLHARPDDSYIFSHWSDDVSGMSDRTSVTMDSNRRVTANFIPNPSEGSLQVNINPAQAVSEGAQWRFDLFTAWRDSGNTQTNITPRVNRYVRFKDIPGWTTPDDIRTDIVGGSTTVLNATYREILGTLQVTLIPHLAEGFGGRWRFEGGDWQESGTTLTDVAPGSHTIEFMDISGWTSPEPQTVSVSRGLATLVTAEYTPPSGQPIITAIAPSTGPLMGGTSVTIDGANFQQNAAISFGGIPATSVILENQTRLTAITPPGSFYGTVEVSLTSGGQTVSRANGFSYLNPMGSNIELMAQIGGNVDAVAVVNNMLYYGEGTALVVVDFTDVSSPVERGRITLPGKIRDIVVSNNVAVVAVGRAGLYVVDVSNSSAPSIVGFYDTEGYAEDVAVFNGIAYIGDSDGGLQILDISAPSAITRLGMLNTGGSAERLAVRDIGSDTYVFVAESDVAVRIIKATTPSAPIEVAHIPAESESGFSDLKAIGTTLYVSDWEAGVKILDISAPAHPIQIALRTNAGDACIDVVGNRLYTCGSIGLRVSDLSSGPTPPFIGTPYITDGDCSRIVVANGMAYMAMGEAGLKVVSVSNPASMSLRATIETIGNPQDVWISNGTAYIGTDTGLHLVDITNPARPIRLAALPGDRVTEVVTTGDLAILVNYGDEVVRIADVSNPSSPTILSTYDAMETWNLTLKEGVPVLVGSSLESYPMASILDISSPSHPQSLGSIQLDNSEGRAGAIAIAGNWAFVGRPNKSLDVVNLSNAAAPQKVGTIEIPYYFRDMAVSEDGKFVYLGGTGMQVVDSSEKSSPTLGLLVDPPYSSSMVDSLWVSGNRLFVTQGHFLYTYDIKAADGSPL